MQWEVAQPDRLTDDQYFAFCQNNRKLKFERTAAGAIVIAPPPGLESAYRCTEVGAELSAWAQIDGRGKAFGSITEFILPDGSALSPNAAWVSHARLSSVPKQELRQVAHVVLSGIDKLEREGPIHGFTLDLTSIWEGI